MSSFKKDWVNKFCSSPSREERIVREAYRSATVNVADRKEKFRPGKFNLPPILNVQRLEDLPQELTVKQVAEFLKYKDHESVTALIRRGLLFAQKEGRQWRIPLWALTKYMTERPASVA